MSRKEKYEGGATRNFIGRIAYNLIEWGFIKAMAAVMFEGAVSHGPTNWRSGMPKGSVINHAMNHLVMWIEGDRSEPHLAKVAVGCMFLWWYEENGKFLPEPLEKYDEH